MSTPRPEPETGGSIPGADAGQAGKPPARLGRPRGGNSGETRQAILDAALRRFAERGYASTTITAIAADLGLSTSTVYHYFDGKEHLYEAVFFAVAPRVWEGMAASVDAAETMVDAIEVLMRGRCGARGQPYVSPSSPACRASPCSIPSSSACFRRARSSRIWCSAPSPSLGCAPGELAGFTVDGATALLRALLVGWFFERHFVGAERDHDIASRGGRAASCCGRLAASRSAPGMAWA